MAAWDPCAETRDATEALVAAAASGDADAVADLEERFSGRLAFGTAGLRGPMGFGANRMNEAVIIQSTQVSRAGLLLGCRPRPRSRPAPHPPARHGRHVHVQGVGPCAASGSKCLGCGHDLLVAKASVFRQASCALQPTLAKHWSHGAVLP